MLHGPGFGASEDETERCEARLVIDHAWHQLDADERDLLRMRFYEERTQQDIADAVGLTQAQVSRILARLLSRLRAQLGGSRPAA